MATSTSTNNLVINKNELLLKNYCTTFIFFSVHAYNNVHKYTHDLSNSIFAETLAYLIRIIYNN